MDVVVGRSLRVGPAYVPSRVILIIRLAAHDFELPKSVILERAAWSWVRTAMLYDRCADNVEKGGSNQRSLGLQKIFRAE